MMLRPSNAGDTFETEEVDLDYMIDIALSCVCEFPDVILWDPFVAPGSRSQAYLARNAYTPRDNDLAYDTATKDQVRRLGVDCIVTNPPFSKKAEILEKFIFDWEVPFVMILPTAALQRNYMQRFLSVGEWQIFIPNRFLRFHVGGQRCHSPPFPSAFFAWKPHAYPAIHIFYRHHRSSLTEEPTDV